MPVDKNKGNKVQNKKGAGYRIGFKTECAIVVTPYKEQGRTEERIQIEIKDHASVPGLWNVAVSRANHPKHNYIPSGQWPSHMDIQVQRLSPFVMEAEIFERAIQIQGGKTLRRWTVESGQQYGMRWTKEESFIADWIGKAYKQRYTTVADVHNFISKQTYKTIHRNVLNEVMAKMELTHERLLKEEAPYLKQAAYESLTDYQNPRNAAKKASRAQKRITV